MNRGNNDSYNQINGNEDIIEYNINLYNPYNNIIIEIPLVKSLYGNIDLSIIYNHQTRNQNNEFGKGYQSTLNLYCKRLASGIKGVLSKHYSNSCKEYIAKNASTKAVGLLINVLEVRKTWD